MEFWFFWPLNEGKKKFQVTVLFMNLHESRKNGTKKFSDLTEIFRGQLLRNFTTQNSLQLSFKKFFSQKHFQVYCLIILEKNSIYFQTLSLWRPKKSWWKVVICFTLKACGNFLFFSPWRSEKKFLFWLFVFSSFSSPHPPFMKENVKP